MTDKEKEFAKKLAAQQSGEMFDATVYQITMADLDPANVPESYARLQTMVNASILLAGFNPEDNALYNKDLKGPALFGDWVPEKRVLPRWNAIHSPEHGIHPQTLDNIYVLANRYDWFTSNRADVIKRGEAKKYGDLPVDQITITMDFAGIEVTQKGDGKTTPFTAIAKYSIGDDNVYPKEFIDYYASAKTPSALYGAQRVWGGWSYDNIIVQ